MKYKQIHMLNHTEFCPRFNVYFPLKKSSPWFLWMKDWEEKEVSCRSWLLTRWDLSPTFYLKKKLTPDTAEKF